MSKLVHLDTNSVWQLKTLQRATSIRIKKKKKSIVSVNKRSRLWRIGQKLPGLINHNSSCFSRMHRLGCMKQTNNKTFIPWVRYCICDTLHGAVSCQGLFFFLFLPAETNTASAETKILPTLSFAARCTGWVSRMGHLIKIGIRGSLWQDLFPGWGNCALRGRLPTSAETVIPWITFTLSAEYHLIKTCRRRFLFPSCLFSIWAAFHFSLLHLIYADLAPVISLALSICHACVVRPIFSSVWVKYFTLCGEKKKTVRRASINCSQYYIFLNVFPILAQVWHFVTVAMPHVLYSANNTCILHIFLLHLHIAYFLSIYWGRRERSLCIVVFHLPYILMILHYFPSRAMTMMHLNFALHRCENLRVNYPVASE